MLCERGGIPFYVCDRRILLNQKLPTAMCCSLLGNSLCSLMVYDVQIRFYHLIVLRLLMSVVLVGCILKHWPFVLSVCILV